MLAAQQPKYGITGSEGAHQREKPVCPVCRGDERFIKSHTGFQIQSDVEGNSAPTETEIPGGELVPSPASVLLISEPVVAASSSGAESPTRPLAGSPQSALWSVDLVASIAPSWS